MIETPRNKYRKDPQFAKLVDQILVFLERRKETKLSELTEAVALACAIYERHKVGKKEDEL